MVKNISNADPLKLLPSNSSSYNFNAGNFALYYCNNYPNYPIYPNDDGTPSDKDVKSVAWYSCRETFHYWSDDCNCVPQKRPEKIYKEYFFAHTKFKEKVVNANNSPALIDRVEDHFELTERTIFRRTSEDRVWSIKPAEFWRKHPIRHQLFSIILRSSLFAGKQDEDLISIFSRHQYCFDTILAVRRFMEGYTDLAMNDGYRYAGWKNLFGGSYYGEKMTDKEVKKVLVKEVKEKYKYEPIKNKNELVLVIDS